MKHLNYSILLFIALTSACSNNTALKKNTELDKNKLLYGTWNCKDITYEEDGTYVDIEIDMKYIRNGKFNSFSKVKLKFPEIPVLEYSYKDSGNWVIKDGYLISTTTKIEDGNLSHQWLDEELSFEDMMAPQKSSSSSQILKLSKTELLIKGESDGRIHTCSKEVNK